MKYIFILLMIAIGLSITPSGELLAHIEKTYFLKGKVGQKELAIKMLCYDEMPTRHIYYFFEDEKRDQYLIGHLIEGRWKFVSGEKEGKSNLHTLNIAESNGGFWKGNWVDSSGKSGDILLAPFTTDSFKTAFDYLLAVQESDAYERYRVSKIRFIKQKTDKLAYGWVADWYSEPESGILLFRLKPGNNKANPDSINTALTAIHLSLVQKYFAYQPVRNEMIVEAAIDYFTEELISFRVSAKTTNTQSATQMRELTTLDVKNGDQVNLEDIVWFDKSENKPVAADLFNIYKYRKNVFAPQIFKILQQLYPSKMKTDSCNINNAETWALPAWGLTNKGLSLSFRTVEECDVLSWAVIPYQKLEPFLENKYHLKTKR